MTFFWNDKACRHYLEMDALLHRLAPDHPEIQRYLALRALSDGKDGAPEELIYESKMLGRPGDQLFFEAARGLWRFTGVTAEPTEGVSLRVTIGNVVILGQHSMTPAAIARCLVFQRPVRDHDDVRVRLHLSTSWPPGDAVTVRILGIPQR
jgi:hypothetical protein